MAEKSPSGCRIRASLNASCYLIPLLFLFSRDDVFGNKLPQQGLDGLLLLSVVSPVACKDFVCELSDFRDRGSWAGVVVTGSVSGVHGAPDVFGSIAAFMGSSGSGGFGLNSVDRGATFGTALAGDDIPATSAELRKPGNAAPRSVISGVHYRKIN